MIFKLEKINIFLNMDEYPSYNHFLVNLFFYLIISQKPQILIFYHQIPYLTSCSMGLSKTISWQPQGPLSPAQSDFKNGTKMKWPGSPSLDQDKRKQTHPSIRDLPVHSPSTDRFVLLQWDFLARKQSTNDLSCNQAKTQEGKVKKTHIFKSCFNNQGLVKMRRATDVPGKPHNTSVRGGNTPKTYPGAWPALGPFAQDTHSSWSQEALSDQAFWKP